MRVTGLAKIADFVPRPDAQIEDLEAAPVRNFLQNMNQTTFVQQSVQK